MSSTNFATERADTFLRGGADAVARARESTPSVAFIGFENPVDARRAAGAAFDAAHRASAAPSATAVVAKIVFVTMLLLLGLTIVATAPLIVASLLALVAGVAVLASLGRRHISRGRIRVTTRRMRLGGDAAWATLGASSVALLVIALAMPDGYDVVLATLGIIGLAVLRLWAIPRPRLGRTAYPSTAVTPENTSSQALAGRRARDDPAGLQQTGRRRTPIAARPLRSTSLDRAMRA